jgi:hypothetical protein
MQLVVTPSCRNSPLVLFDPLGIGRIEEQQLPEVLKPWETHCIHFPRNSTDGTLCS